MTPSEPTDPWPTCATAQTQAWVCAVALPDRVAELLEMLVTLGQARQTAEGRFVG